MWLHYEARLQEFKLWRHIQILFYIFIGVVLKAFSAVVVIKMLMDILNNICKWKYHNYLLLRGTYWKTFEGAKPIVGMESDRISYVSN